jgi:hypothetical protein
MADYCDAMRSLTPYVSVDMGDNCTYTIHSVAHKGKDTQLISARIWPVCLTDLVW